MTPQNPCFCCGGAYHPTTGDFDPVWKVAFCAPCVERRKKWYKQQVNRGVSGDTERARLQDDFATFYQAAETSIRPGTDGTGSGFTRFVRVPNPQPKEKVPRRAGRWRAGSDGVRVQTGPRAWRPFVWVAA